MLLEKTYLFQGIASQTLQRISEIACEEAHPAGTFLFHAGDPADYLFILVAGHIRLRVGGKGHIANAISEPGEIFGLSSMVELEQYTSSAECVLPTKAIKIEKNALMQLLEKDPRSGLIFFQHFSKVIAQRLVNCYKATVSVHGERDPRSYG